MAGIKLHEENLLIRVLTEAYTRIVIYPRRYLEIIRSKIKEPHDLVQEVLKSNSINRAAMKALARVKAQGKMVLVYPAGTRFRPWDSGSKRGVREIDSYIKTFDAMVFISINGNVLRINPRRGNERGPHRPRQARHDREPGHRLSGIPGRRQSRGRFSGRQEAAGRR